MEENERERLIGELRSLHIQMISCGLSLLRTGIREDTALVERMASMALYLAKYLKQRWQEPS